MKKIMFAAAVAAAGLAFGVESANTVGYTTQNFMLKSTFYMMGSQFETTGGASLKLSEIDFGDMTGAPYFDEDGDFAATAPQVRIAFANHEGFTTYYYLADGAENMKDPGWTDVGGNPADPVIPAGIGFWYNNSASASPVMTTAGAVIDDVSVEKTFDKTFRVLVNPYPVETKLSDIDFGGILTGAPVFDEDGNFAATAPQIRVPFADHEGFTTYYYLADGAENMIDPGWTDVGGNPITDANMPKIPVGRGCWFKPATDSVTVTFTAP